MTIRKALNIDATEISAIEAQTFSLPWSHLEILTDLNNPIATYFVATDAGTIVGYAGYWLVVGEANITNVAVATTHRNLGIATNLLTTLIASLKSSAAVSAFLEVRASNATAKHLYAKFGFVPISVRKNYYKCPPEDAIIMKLEF